MRNKFILLIALSFTVLSVFAQKNAVNLISSNDNETVLTFKTESYDFKTVKTPKGEELVILSEGLSSILEKGSPDLPKYTESLIIPDKDKMKVEIISSKFEDIENINIAPSKGNFTRDIDPATIPYEYGKVYNKDAFYPNNTASLDKPYIVRDYRGQALHVYPFAYNPVTKTLRIYTEIKVKVSTTGKEGVNKLNRTKSFSKIDREFKNIYSNHFINYGSSKYTPLEEEGNMLVICYDDWTTEMQTFVDWKNTIGRPCEMVTVTDAGGTSANIGTYVENYYNTNGLTYLLLVGDAAQVPTKYSNGDSDNAYAYITGSDHYLEFFVGRFSAESAAHVTTQVLRTIEYEKGDQLTDGWLNITMGVTSDQGPGDDNEMDYEHYRNIATDLLAFTYTESRELFDGSQGGNDASGSPSSAMVGNEINNGVGIINYTGHGSDFSWVSSGFDVSDVNNLTNDNKLPFIFDVACVNGNFEGQTCFGEAFLRAENNGEPTGAIAICASTINQSWDPPMNAQDEMVDLIAGISANGVKRTFTGIVVNGLFLMNDDDGDFAMTDTWTTFGDPSVYIRTDNTSDMVISHNDVILVGVSNFDLSCDLDGALATLSRDGEILGSEVVSGGTASVPVSEVTPGETLTLAVVGFNKVTYLTDLSVIAPSGPYLVVESYLNNVDFGQSVNLDMVLENVGQDPASGVSVTVSTSDANANITNETFEYGNIAASSLSSPSSGVFTLTVDNDIEDQYTIAINIAITDDEGKTLWESTKNVTVNAPVFNIGNLTINDAAGNGDGILDPGENADINIQTTNNGHADVTNVIGVISTLSPDLIINSAITSAYDLSVGETKLFTFNVTASAGATEGTMATFEYIVSGGLSSQYVENNDFEIIIGFVPEYCTAGSDNTSDEFIERVQFIDIDNSSTQGPAYTDYTNISTDVTLEESYPITITNGEHFSSDQMGCWVDWNYDGDFDDANEEFTINYSDPDGTGTITVPSDARIGSTRMRLRVMYSGTISPCGDASYGEVEDYTLNVIPNVTQGGILTASNSQICEGSNTGDITLSSFSGTITAWEKKVNGGDWTTIIHTTETYSEIPTQTGTWNYRVEVDGGAAYSNETTIIVNETTIGGAVTGGSTICEGSEIGTLSLGGHTGNIMKWQKALDGGVWEDISNNTTTYIETPIEDGSWSYRAVVQSGSCSQENSASTDVIVNPAAVSGTVSATSSQICAGSEANLTLTGYEGSIQWQESADGTIWSDILDANSENYTSGTLTDNMFFCAVVSLGSCENTESNSVEIEIFENSVADYTFNADNQTISFTNNSLEATSYSWDFGDSNNSTDENPVHIYSASGTYSVVLTASNGVCDDREHTENIDVTYVGISQIELNVKIVPNPNTGLFTINLGNLNVSETTINIYSVSGQKVYQKNAYDNILDIDLSNYAKGVYFIKITSGNEAYNSKIILK